MSRQWPIQESNIASLRVTYPLLSDAKSVLIWFIQGSMRRWKKASRPGHPMGFDVRVQRGGSGRCALDAPCEILPLSLSQTSKQAFIGYSGMFTLKLRSDSCIRIAGE